MPEDPPTISTTGRVLAPTPDEAKAAGKWGHVPERDCLGFVTQRDSHAHRIRKFDAYALSVSVLNTLTDLGVERVFIHETDTGDVYEFLLDDFTEWGKPVPDDVLEHPSDPQRYHSRDDPAALWSGHASAFYVSEKPPDDAGFTPASELGGDDE